MLILCYTILRSIRIYLGPVQVVLPDEPIDRIAKPQLQRVIARLSVLSDISQGVSLHEKQEQFSLVIIQWGSLNLLIQAEEHTHDILIGLQVFKLTSVSDQLGDHTLFAERYIMPFRGADHEAIPPSSLLLFSISGGSSELRYAAISAFSGMLDRETRSITSSIGIKFLFNT